MKEDVDEGSKEHYVVLGVHRGENAKGIRAAYKDLAKQFHPDRIGEQGNKTFQEISEAYQTLSDPEKRRLYNHSLDQEENARSEVGSETSSRRDWGLASLGWEAVP
ncbi:MAG TPA: J domain-containing protein [Terriglobia bacterium]|nr:J domain-containing protein [Terriglobia bacterium]